jgi:hypothetical protein
MSGGLARALGAEEIVDTAWQPTAQSLQSDRSVADPFDLGGVSIP